MTDNSPESSLKIYVQTEENASSNLCDLARINGKFKSLRTENFGFGRDGSREDSSGGMEYSTELTLVSLPSEIKLKHSKTLT